MDRKSTFLSKFSIHFQACLPLYETFTVEVLILRTDTSKSYWARVKITFSNFLGNFALTFTSKCTKSVAEGSNFRFMSGSKVAKKITKSYVDGCPIGL